MEETQVLKKHGSLSYHELTYLTEHFINHPFYEDEPNYFSHPSWQVAQFINDFFIHPINFDTLKAMMDVYQETHFVICDAHAIQELKCFTLKKDLIINKFRKDLDKHDLWFNDWYLFSAQKNWAVVSVSDDDALYIGYLAHPKIDEQIQQNPNFERFLKHHHLTNHDCSITSCQSILKHRTILNAFGKAHIQDLTLLTQTSINHPFNEYEPNYFSNNNWVVAVLANDFFIEKSNYELIQQLMTLHKEQTFMASYVSTYQHTLYINLGIDFNLQEFRKALVQHLLYSTDWYLFSQKNNWAAISINDSDIIHIGYATHPKIDELIQQNPNFQSFLSASQAPITD